MYIMNFADKEQIRDWLINGRYKMAGAYPHRGCSIDAAVGCTLACPACRRQWHKTRGLPPNENGKNMCLFEIQALNNFYTCFQINGQISDPVMNPDLDVILRCIRNRTSCNIHTAATPKWLGEDHYRKLFAANTNIKWIFGIDGLPKDSHQYRVGQDGEKLFNMMLIAKEMGLDTCWQYIVFKYNENDVEEARELAHKHGLSLELTISSRWSDENDPLRPTLPEYRGKTWQDI